MNFVRSTILLMTSISFSAGQTTLAAEGPDNISPFFYYTTAYHLHLSNQAALYDQWMILAEDGNWEQVDEAREESEQENLFSLRTLESQFAVQVSTFAEYAAGEAHYEYVESNYSEPFEALRTDAASKGSELSKTLNALMVNRTREHASALGSLASQAKVLTSKVYLPWMQQMRADICLQITGSNQGCKDLTTIYGVLGDYTLVTSGINGLYDAMTALVEPDVAEIDPNVVERYKQALTAYQFKLSAFKFLVIENLASDESLSTKFKSALRSESERLGTAQTNLHQKIENIKNTFDAATSGNETDVTTFLTEVNNGRRDLEHYSHELESSFHQLSKAILETGDKR